MTVQDPNYNPEDFQNLSKLAEYHDNLMKMLRYDILTPDKKKFLSKELKETTIKVNKLKKKIKDFKMNRLDRFEDEVFIESKLRRIKCKVRLYRTVN